MEANNTAALREACTNIAEYTKAAKCHTTDAHILGYLDQIESWAKAALAKPPRNCDIGTAAEQNKRLCSNFFSIRQCGSFTHTALVWAQTPYAESEVSHGNA